MSRYRITAFILALALILAPLSMFGGEAGHAATGAAPPDTAMNHCADNQQTPDEQQPCGMADCIATCLAMAIEPLVIAPGSAPTSERPETMSVSALTGLASDSDPPPPRTG